MRSKSFITSVVVRTILLFGITVVAWLNLFPKAVRDEGTFPTVTRYYGFPFSGAIVSEMLEGDGGFQVNWHFVSVAIDVIIAGAILLEVRRISVRLMRAVPFGEYFSRSKHRLSFHLSTTILLSSAAAVLLWFNMRWIDMRPITIKMADSTFIEMQQKGAGWPIIFRYEPESFLWEGTPLLIDILVGLVLLASTHVIYESWIFRSSLKREILR